MDAWRADTAASRLRVPKQSSIPAPMLAPPCAFFCAKESDEVYVLLKLFQDISCPKNDCPGACTFGEFLRLCYVQCRLAYICMQAYILLHTSINVRTSMRAHIHTIVIVPACIHTDGGGGGSSLRGVHPVLWRWGACGDCFDQSNKSCSNHTRPL